MKVLDSQTTHVYSAAAHESIHLAQIEATRLHDPIVEPEHLLLSLIMQQDAEVMQVLQDLGLDVYHLKRRVHEVFTGTSRALVEKSNPPLSQNLLYCLDFASSFATDLAAVQVAPVHLLLACLRDERVQPLLVLLAPTPDNLPAFIANNVGPAYTSAVDQFIRSRLRQQTCVSLNDHTTLVMLAGFERPYVLFSDIPGRDSAKYAFYNMVRFLKKPWSVQPTPQPYIQGIVVVGYPSSERTLLIRAVAGESVVPLLTLSFSTLLSYLRAYEPQSLDGELPAKLRRLLGQSENYVHKGRHAIHFMFEQAKQFAPCILLLDDIDVLDSIATLEEHQSWQQQLYVELDGLDIHPSMAVIATTHHLTDTTQALLQTGRFVRQVVAHSGFQAQAASATKMCHACTREIMASWKHCVYCGATVARICRVCQAMQIEIAGAHFCPDCGTQWSE